MSITYIPNAEGQNAEAEAFRTIIYEAFKRYGIEHNQNDVELKGTHFTIAFGGSLTFSGQSAAWALGLVVQFDRIILNSYTSPTFDIDAQIPHVTAVGDPQYFLFETINQREALNRLALKRLTANNVVGDHNTRIASAVILATDRLRQHYEAEE